MNKSKVAVFTYSLAGGGAERVAANVLIELSRIADVELILIREDNIVYEIPKNCKTTVLSKIIRDNAIFRLLLLPSLSYKLSRYLRKNNIDAIVSFMEYPNWLVSFMRFYGWKGKIIISEQVSPIQEYVANTAKGEIGRRLNKFLYPKADKIIACSKGVKHELENILGIKNDYSVIYNPVNLKIAQTQIDNCIPKEYDKYTFINVSAFRPQKNHLLLIDSFAKLQNDSCQLILVGRDFGDSVGEAIRNRITELNMQDKIMLAGFTTNPFEYLVNADCFVLSSNYEGLPNVLLEAMFCNLQIVSTDCRTGPREILAPETDFYTLCDTVEKNNFGYLTPVGNEAQLCKAMELVLSTKQDKLSISALAQKRCSDFDLQQIGQQFCEAVTSSLLKN
jgi:N-acetylgalactosamine-N,N'-diacetylbacillosaminyl-diphospho-undecaprenol 4-alpha-N-acetylgalactosaminyltransferase